MHHRVIRSFGYRVLAFVLSAVLALSLLAVPSPHRALAVPAQEMAGGAALDGTDVDALLAAGDYAEGEAIVVVDEVALGTVPDMLSGAEELMEADDGVDSGDGLSILHVVRPGADTAELIAELADVPGVLSVEPNYLVEPPDDAPAVLPEDFGLTAMAATDAYGAYDRTFDLSPWQWSTQGQLGKTMTLPNRSLEEDFSMHVPVWNDASAANTADCVVAVLDTGVDYNHPDLADSLYTFDEELQAQLGCGRYGASFAGNDPRDPMDDHGHGTHCAGAVAAAWNGAGTSGVAKGVKVMAVKVSDESYTYPMSALIKGYDFVARAADAGVPVRITSNSYGGGEQSVAQNVALARLGEHGVVSLFASGNEHKNTDAEQDGNVFPHNPYVIVVNATTPDGNPSAFTNYGSTTDVFAPGAFIVSTVPAFASRYFAPADKTPLAYASTVSTDGTWDTGIFVADAWASTFDFTTDDNDFESAEMAPVAIEQGASPVSFDGDGASMQVTLGDVSVPNQDADDAEVIYLDLELPVAADAAYASLAVYVDGYAGTWSYEATGADKPGIYSWLMAQVEKPADGGGTATGWVRDADLYNTNECSWQQVALNLERTCAGARMATTDNGCVQLRLKLRGTSGVRFTKGTRIYLDCVGVGARGTAADLPYAFWDGTSMATPTAAGAVAVIARGMGTELADDVPARARRLVNLTKACVSQRDVLSGRCSSNGQLDLALLDTDGRLNMDQAAPVVDEVTVVDGKIVIEGFAFGDAGSVAVDGVPLEVESWETDGEGNGRITCAWPASMAGGSKLVSVTSATSGKVGSGRAYLNAPDEAARLFERELSTTGCVVDPTDIIADLTDLDGTPYALVCDPEARLVRVASYDADADAWASCPALPCGLAQSSVTAHAGTLLVLGFDDGGSARLYGLAPGASGWTEFDATCLPASSGRPKTLALASCGGDLLVVGLLTPEDEMADRASVMRVTLAPVGAAGETSGEVVATLHGNYEREIGDGIYPASAGARGNAVYVGNPQRVDEDGVGPALERIERGADGSYAVTDLTPLVRQEEDEDAAAFGAALSAEAEAATGVTFKNESENSFAVAAAAEGPVVVGARGWRADVLVDADSFVMRDDSDGFAPLDRRLSNADVSQVVAHVAGDTLYAAAVAPDERVGYLIRATSLGAGDDDGEGDDGGSGGAIPPRTAPEEGPRAVSPTEDRRVTEASRTVVPRTGDPSGTAPLALVALGMAAIIIGGELRRITKEQAKEG